MSVTDPIADMLTCIRNASTARHDTVHVAHSKAKVEIARLMVKEGFLADSTVEGEGNKRVLRMYLRYQPDGEPVIQGLKRASTPGRRRYVGTADIPRVLNGIGIAVISTSSGLVTDRVARKNHQGGEVLCTIW